MYTTICIQSFAQLVLTIKNLSHKKIITKKRINQCFVDSHALLYFFCRCTVKIYRISHKALQVVCLITSVYNNVYQTYIM